MKYVEAGVNLVSEDVQELSQAIVEDTQARFTNLAFWLALIDPDTSFLIGWFENQSKASYTALTTATYSTIEKVKIWLNDSS